MYGWVLLIGAAVGFGGGYACFHSRLEVLAVKHAGARKELQDEITRLRSQVARIIGVPTIGDEQIAHAKAMLGLTNLAGNK